MRKLIKRESIVGGFLSPSGNVSNFDLNDGTADPQIYEIMGKELAEGLTIRDALNHIQKCREERIKFPNSPIEVPGLSWAGCSYNKIL